MSTKAEERLQELLDLKDEEIERLEDKVYELEREVDADHTWTKHTKVEEEEHLAERIRESRGLSQS